MLDVVPEAGFGELRVGQQVGDLVDGEEDQVAALALMEQFLHREILGELQEQGGDDVDVLGAVLVAATVGFIQHLVVAGYLVDPFGEGVPLAGGDDAGGDPTVLAGVCAKGDDEG